MKLKEKNGLKWLEFDIFADFLNLKHGVFLRDGGQSQGPYAALNLADNVGDEMTHVQSNREIVAKTLEVSEMIYMRQCHGTNHCEISMSPDTLLSGDSMSTKIPGFGLMIAHADCQVGIMYDPVHHAIASVHSGWRGSVQNIYGKTIDYMAKVYGTNPADLLVGISPSLGPGKAEFINYRTELPKAFWDYQVKTNYFDFWQISRMQLRESGVLDDHIEVAGMDTYTDLNFFSFRRDKITGRNGTVIALR